MRFKEKKKKRKKEKRNDSARATRAHPTEINILMADAVVTPAPTRRTPESSVDRGSTTCHVYEF